MIGFRIAAAWIFLGGAFAADLAPFDTVQTRLATPAGFGAVDFDLLINYRGGVPKTLSAVETLLRRPQSVDSLVPAMRQSLADTAAGGIVRSEALWRWLDVPPPPASAETSLPDLLRSAEKNLAAYLKPLSADQIAFLRREAPPLFRHTDEDTSLGAIASERERLRGDAVTDTVLRLADRLPMGSLAAAARDLDGALFALRAALSRGGVPAAVALLEDLRKRGVPVEIGTSGDDVHRLDRGIVFDPGGNDRYEFPDTTRPGSWLLVVDLAGDDTYHAADTVGAAAGFLSLQIVADLGGNDRYLGGDFAFGSAVLGYSRLFDAGGDDSYEGRCASLGFAFYGLGILQDASGNDVYSSYYMSQAASSTHGLGILMDGAGNDQYLSRPAYVDDLRYRDHFLSLSQGFSTGFSPKYAGGIAVLWDRAGEDLYSADIFGQGTGYWFSWGLLMDDAGNDKFLAYQYAQGAGVHFAVGTLWDGSGNDLRVSKGVSQGCGHDGGFGMLVDAAGNDRNVATDMSQGAGSANGLGVFADFAGDDVYAGENPRMALGHGDMRRDRGSTGFFLDLGGNDAYPPEFRNDSAWRAYDGKHRGYGYGLDAP